jgi:hypothetical protein
LDYYWHHNHYASSKIFYNNFTGNEIGLNISDSEILQVRFNTFHRNNGPAIINRESGSVLIVENAFLFNNGSGEIFDPGNPQVMEMYKSANHSSFWCRTSSGFGNYWSDLTGPDLDSDGIVDEPYLISKVISGSGTKYLTMDMFPMTEPFMLFHIEEILAYASTGYRDEITIYWKSRYEKYDIDHFTVFRGTDPYDLRSIGNISSNSDNIVRYYDQEVKSGIYYYYQVATVRFGEIVSFSGVVKVEWGDPRSYLNITEPGDHLITNETEISVKWDIFDDENIIERCRVTIRGPGRSMRDVECEENEVYIYEMEDGLYRVNVEVRDIYRTLDDAEIEIRVDTVPPYIEPGSIKCTTEASNGSVKVEWQADDDYTGIELTEFLIDESVWISTRSHADEIWLENLTQGESELTIKVHDRAGNFDMETVEIDIDNVAPDFNILWPPNGEHINEHLVNVIWKYSDSVIDLSRFRIQMENDEWLDVGMNTSHEFNIEGEGTYNVSIRSIDHHGNRRTKSISFTTDYTIPTVELIHPNHGSSEVDLNTFIHVKFSEKMIHSTVNISLHATDGSLTFINDTYVFIPHQKLFPDVIYDLSVSGADLAGNWMETQHSYFQTEGKGTVIGTVMNYLEVPLNDVEVLIDGKVVTSTDNDGFFSLILGDGEYNITFHKEKYINTSLMINVHWGRTNDLGIIILMHPDPHNPPPTEDEKEDHSRRILISIVITTILLLILAFLLIHLYGLKKRFKKIGWNYEE